MTWEELKEKAKEMGYSQAFWEDGITNGLLEFYKSGSIVVYGEVLAHNRTPEQMLMIMRGLE